MRRLCGGLFALMLAMMPQCAPAAGVPDAFWDYQDDLSAAAEVHLPCVDWRLLGALIWQESQFNPQAVSPAGAVGLGQFVIGTWTDVQPEIDAVGVDRHDPRAAIDGAAFYLAQRMRFWTLSRSIGELVPLGLACYNAGCGNVLRAQQKLQARGLAARTWGQISRAMDDVTGKTNADETRGYVAGIQSKYFDIITTVPAARDPASLCPG